MEQTPHEFKYQKHSEKEFEAILATAEQLFTKKGIDKVGLADIAATHGIARPTFYRYFRNKEEILWHIMRRHTTVFSDNLRAKFKTTGSTARERYETFLNVIYDIFITNSESFLFIDLFNDTYQYVTSGNDNKLYNEVYTGDDFRSGETVQFLTENFDDGTLKPGLDAKETAVMITYTAISIAIGMTKQIKTLNVKYGVQPERVVRSSLNALLDGIRA